MQRFPFLLSNYQYQGVAVIGKSRKAFLNGRKEIPFPNTYGNRDVGLIWVPPTTLAPIEAGTRMRLSCIFAPFHDERQGHMILVSSVVVTTE